ncbi:transcriptional regulator BetI [Ectothiorhodospira lacustris]|uniref:transcriptional regulator BetI n=1 Tax=Ectothiorhodospira lacustris TaxID=2899127 RepID=UPI001EE80C42|nr:transcriptional regulator BetI [Ectothiorhodospira lacustris]MCG5501587.1 transcriptional regulator BetI [Ectothiorhodospira lacustris]MCG5508980.1 transcriptional regulator BetI [Ectothiorhodospira lacustris]MCG5520771.1 transcriptional regulator BetI [Ectothiorhodospira lacustris]
MQSSLMAAGRRRQLISATLTAIHQYGMADATIARIARLAGVSTGIISHYFGDKAGLMEATMRHLLQQLGEAVAERRRQIPAEDVAGHVNAIIDGNFDSSQTNVAAMRAWLEFWAASMHQPSLRRLQRVNERRLYANLCHQFRKVMPADQARDAARSVAALIDGLWLRGALTPAGIDIEACRRLARDNARAWLGQHVPQDFRT